MIAISSSAFILLGWVGLSKLNSIRPNQTSRRNDFPEELLNTVYFESDFKNTDGNIPAYWQNYFESNTSENNTTDDGEILSWGPCYPPDPHEGRIKWNDIAHEGSIDIEYAKLLVNPKSKVQSVRNMCRPGFLIIGAGKCGTSSLYHYLTGHPRVLPASEKQIHYFKVWCTFDAFTFAHYSET